MCSELLTAEEIGERLRLTADTVLKWAREGTIPSIKLSPKVLRFDPSEVEAALRRRSAECSQ